MILVAIFLALILNEMGPDERSHGQYLAGLLMWIVLLVAALAVLTDLAPDLFSWPTCYPNCEHM